MARLPGGLDDPGPWRMTFPGVAPGLCTSQWGSQSARRILIRWAPHTTSSTAMASTTSLVRWTKAREAEQRRLRGLRGSFLTGLSWLGLQSNDDDTPQRRYLDKDRHCGVNPRDPTHSSESMSRLVMAQPRRSLVGFINSHTSFDQRSQKERVPATDPGAFRRGPRASLSKGMDGLKWRRAASRTFPGMGSPSAVRAATPLAPALCRA